MKGRGSAARKNLPRPFLKWVGGKGQLLPELLVRVEQAGTFGRYHEPFVGGGALFFELARTKAMRKHAWLSDNNAPLVETYQGVKEDVEAVIRLLLEHKSRHDKEHYYEVRAKGRETPAGTQSERAARIIYLNKTCFNGLYRENSKGQFNTPMGRYKNPLICDEPNLRTVSKALKKAKIEQLPFASVLDRAQPDDLVYFDPPYHPVSKTASFTAYDKGGFGEDAQRELASVFAQLSENGVKVLLSNSMTGFVEDLYRSAPIKNLTIDTVNATRRVNSRADRRGKIGEALIRNF